MVRGLGLTTCQIGSASPILVPSPCPWYLTWCQFCMERLILGIEPGCSLFMSVHNMIPSFRPFGKSGPMERPVRPSIQVRSSTSS